MRLGKRLVVLSSLLALLATTGLADSYSPRVGERHADFTLPAIENGRPISLAQLRGKKVLLIQFASW